MATTTSRLAVDSMADYEIRIQGRLHEDWSDRMDGVTIQMECQPNEAPVTVLTGAFQDQAALVGVLNTLYDLGFPLLSVECRHIQPSNFHELMSKAPGLLTDEALAAQTAKLLGS